jgi:hypothetical protein
VTQTIRCLYSCSSCGLKNQAVQVPSRGEESVTDWMENTFMPAISRDHSSRSPHCMSGTMTEVKIPIEGADKIGGIPAPETKT